MAVFYMDWENDKLDELTDYLKKHIYEKHVIKVNILQRDNFTCQNHNCNRCNNVLEYEKLTVHHLRFKKNHGEDKERNAVTLCHSIHNGNSGYHNAKAALVFSADAMNLPPHIRGHTFKLQKPDKFDWKEMRARLSNLRKEIRKKSPTKNIDWETIYILFKWLNIPYYEMEYDDD